MTYSAWFHLSLREEATNANRDFEAGKVSSAKGMLDRVGNSMRGFEAARSCFYRVSPFARFRPRRTPGSFSLAFPTSFQLQGSNTAMSYGAWFVHIIGYSRG